MAATPEALLRSFIEKLDPNEQKLFRAVRSAVRKRLPAANELAYDYSNGVVIAYSPTERGIDGFLSIAARAGGVRLYLMQGPRLPDPKKLLQGTGKQARFIPLDAARRVAHPDVEALIAAAIDLAGQPSPSEERGKLVIRTGGEKKPPRRRPAK